MKRSEIVDYILNGLRAKKYPCQTEACKHTACITCVENQLAECLYKVKKTSYEKGRTDAFTQIIMYLNDASLAQSGKCYDCTQELMKIIEDMEERECEQK